METVLTGVQRRKIIIDRMRQASGPISGGVLGRETGVSRQVIVQDITLLRAEGYAVVATARGYVLDEPKQCVRVFKVYHDNSRTEEELMSIVDLGGCVQDVMINHRAYGKLKATLNIKNRRDVQKFMEQLHTGKSMPLLNVTSGYHFHKVSADKEEILDEIEEMLKEKLFLAEFMTYEYDLID